MILYEGLERELEVVLSTSWLTDMKPAVYIAEPAHFIFPTPHHAMPEHMSPKPVEVAAQYYRVIRIPVSDDIGDLLNHIGTDEINITNRDGFVEISSRIYQSEAELGKSGFAKIANKAFNLLKENDLIEYVGLFEYGRKIEGYLISLVKSISTTANITFNNYFDMKSPTSEIANGIYSVQFRYNNHEGIYTLTYDCVEGKLILSNPKRDARKNHLSEMIGTIVQAKKEQTDLHQKFLQDSWSIDEKKVKSFRYVELVKAANSKNVYLGSFVSLVVDKIFHLNTSRI